MRVSAPRMGDEDMKQPIKIDPETAEKIGRRILEVRRHLRLRQQGFADTLDISPSYLSAIESGKGKPTIGFFYTLSATHKVSLDYLFHGIGDTFNGGIDGGEADDRKFPDDIEDIDDLVWLVRKSSIFRNSIFAFGIRFLVENREVIMKNVELKRRKNKESPTE